MGERAVFLTGATGFLGGYVLRRLAARGDRVSALARPSSERGPLAGVDLTWLTGDVTDAASVDAALARAAGAARAEGLPLDLVHGAAVISYRTGSGALQDAVNVEGTRHVLAAARRHGVRRLLLVSSVVAVGLAPDADTAIDEDWPFERVREVAGRPFVGDYMRTKRAAEELVLAADDLEVVVVNPGAIFGEAATPSNTARIFHKLEHDWIGRIAAPGSLAVVGADDVADGILLALDQGRPGRRYLLTDESLRLVELMERIGAALGLARRPLGVPRPLWPALVAGARVVDRVRPLRIVTPTALELLGRHFRFDSTRARTELGWAPRPFDEVLGEVVTWLRRIGWVRGGTPGQ